MTRVRVGTGTCTVLRALLLVAAAVVPISGQDLVPPDSALREARVALASGDLERARSAYMDAAAGLTGAQATRVLSVALLLGRVSPEGAKVLGAAMSELGEARPDRAVAMLRAGPALPVSDRAPLLGLAAEIAEGAGLAGEAEAVWRTLIEEHPESTEAPGALLALGTRLGSDPDGRAEARELLERLILEYPSSALVPQARRELSRLPRSADADGGKRD